MKLTPEQQEKVALIANGLMSEVPEIINTQNAGVDIDFETVNAYVRYKRIDIEQTPFLFIEIVRYICMNSFIKDIHFEAIGYCLQTLHPHLNPQELSTTDIEELIYKLPNYKGIKPLKEANTSESVRIFWQRLIEIGNGDFLY